MSSWLEWGDCPNCGQYVVSECDTDTGELYYWHTDTGQKECLIDNANINLDDWVKPIQRW
jgi:hypothetical protein